MRRITSVLLFFCVLILSVGCGGQVKPREDVTSARGAEYQITNQTYTDKKVVIKYPQITGLSDNSVQSKINEIIKNDALEVGKGYSDTDAVTITIDYKIMCQSARIISIVYSGIRDPKGAAHPTNEFYTTNIDMKTVNKLRLKDIVNIDDTFIEKLKKGTVIHASPGEGTLGEVLEGRDMSVSALQSADVHDNKENRLGIYSYFTSDSLGFSVQGNHAIGDHSEVELKYHDIANNLNPESEIGKSLGK